MRTRTLPALLIIVFAAAVLTAQSGSQTAPAQTPQQGTEGFKFRAGVELINVTATVTDRGGRFVPGLQAQDFRVFDDNRPQPITHFSAERVPVSLGIVLDTSGSMAGEKMEAARDALDRFLVQLLDPQDEVFLYRFDNSPDLIEGWTRDKRKISDAVRRIQPHGGTALYDAVAEAVQVAQQGHNRKKAVVIISDGNDTASRTDIIAVQQLIRQTEVLVYAIGIDMPTGPTQASFQQPLFQRPGGPPRFPIPFPFPRPGGGRPKPPNAPQPPGPQGPGGINRGRNGGDDRVNAAALRSITDDSGGRTEIIRLARDLDPATAGIADELSRQYYMGYTAPNEKDGRWHDIRVETRDPTYLVRARRGYVSAAR